MDFLGGEAKTRINVLEEMKKHLFTLRRAPLIVECKERRKMTLVLSEKEKK